MFTIILWDQLKNAEISRIKNLKGNENFLIQNKSNLYPLLSNLADCDEDLFCGDSLKKLILELNDVKSCLKDAIHISHFEEIIELTKKAIDNNLCILFTPFLV